MKNAITIDVEDWHHCMVSDFTTWSSHEDRIVHSTTKVLNLLKEADTKATFFILGYVAETHPELVVQIQNDGHEIASHGYYHQFVYDLSPDEFRDDLKRTADRLEEITGKRPSGYRAPFFSITKRNWWALDVLTELGYEYDASIFPVHNHRYGVPDAPRFPYKIQANNKEIAELPVSTVKLGANWPAGGGVYFRFLPYFFIKKAVQRINRERQPAMLYVHPWEMDPEQPVLEGLHPLFKARRYLNLDKTEDKWRALLRDFEFGPINEVYAQELAQ